MPTVARCWVLFSLVASVVAGCRDDSSTDPGEGPSLGAGRGGVAGAGHDPASGAGTDGESGHGGDPGSAGHEAGGQGGAGEKGSQAGSAQAGSAGQAAGGGATAGQGGHGPACSPDVPRDVPLAVAVQPEVTEAPFVQALGQAKSEIRVMIYLMGTGAILDTLEAKASAGLSVRVILDKKQDANVKYFDQLQSKGVKVQWSNPEFTYVHAKVMVVDDQVAVISTGNYSLSYMKKQRNFVVTDRDPADVASLVTLFDADWQGQTPDLSCTRLLVAPVNARERLLDLIASAQQTLDIESMQFADTAIRAAVVERKKAGVEVRALLADPAWISDNQDAATFLAAQQIPVRYLSNPAVHTKAILVDGARVYLGSENLSYTSLSHNREVGLVSSEAPVVATVSATFAGDWAAAVSF